MASVMLIMPPADHYLMPPDDLVCYIVLCYANPLCYPSHILNKTSPQLKRHTQASQLLNENHQRISRLSRSDPPPPTPHLRLRTEKPLKSLSCTCCSCERSFKSWSVEHCQELSYLSRCVL